MNPPTPLHPNAQGYGVGNNGEPQSSGFLRFLMIAGLGAAAGAVLMRMYDERNFDGGELEAVRAELALERAHTAATDAAFTAHLQSMAPAPKLALAAPGAGMDSALWARLSEASY